MTQGQTHQKPAELDQKYIVIDAANQEQLRQKAMELHQKYVVIDALEACPELGDVSYFENMAKNGLTGASITVFETYDTPAEALRRLRPWYDLFNQHSDKVVHALKASDIDRAKKEGKTAVIMNFQNGEVMGRDLNLLSVYHRLGIRVMQPCYYEQNLLGEGAGERTDGGLSHLGIEAVAEMNRLGVVVDCSHCGDQTSLDIIKFSKAPVLATHSNPRSVVYHKRNKTDEIIKALADKGGVIGMVGWSRFCEITPGVRPGVQEVLDMVDYVVKLVGPDHVGFGLDLNPFMSIESHLAWAAHYPELRPNGGFYERTIFTRKDDGVDDISRFPELTMGLIARGYSDADIGKILGGNFLRVFREVWGG